MSVEQPVAYIQSLIARAEAAEEVLRSAGDDHITAKYWSRMRAAEKTARAEFDGERLALAARIRSLEIQLAEAQAELADRVAS